MDVRRTALRGVLLVLALLCAAPARAQVGGPPLPPPTLWNFLGIPQGIRKIQGATRNRNGNHPNREPKPPLKAIADPRNLESKDASIKKAAEIKQAEDLKKQKIKAVKYLASIGCGCYDVDGGVTAALIASMSDCTEEVRYETIKAITEAAQEGCCSKCGSSCCCNKDMLTAMAKVAYERDDHGCYLEPSARVRQAAAEALVACCPNSSPPVIVAPEEPAVAPEREGGESIEPAEGDLREGEPLTPPPAAPAAPGEALPADDVTQAAPGDAVSLLPQESASDAQRAAEGFGFGVVVHVSPEHQLAHVHFDQNDLLTAVGSQVGVYREVGGVRKLVTVLQIVEAFPGSATVTGDIETLATVARGDVVMRPPAMLTVHESPSQETLAAAVVPAETVTEVPLAELPFAEFSDVIEGEVAVQDSLEQDYLLIEDYSETSAAPVFEAAPAAQEVEVQASQVIEASNEAPIVAPHTVMPKRAVRTARPRITATFLR